MLSIIGSLYLVGSQVAIVFMIGSSSYMTLKNSYWATRVKKKIIFAIDWHKKYSLHFCSFLKLELYWRKGIWVIVVPR
jgi:hypothetical protein